MPYTRRMWLIMVLLATVWPANAQDHEKKRRAMVRTQIEGRGISDESVLEALRRVPRHLFVPEGQRPHAYEDRPLPIGKGQTISQPYIVAYMTALLQPEAADKILEVGPGSGYQAAVLAEMVEDVYTIEIVPVLARTARRRLHQLGYDNVHVKQGDGYQGWKAHAPYDGIIVTAAPNHVPPPLVDQLKEGGRLVIPVGARRGVQTLKLIKKERGQIVTEDILRVRFVPFQRAG